MKKCGWGRLNGVLISDMRNYAVKFEILLRRFHEEISSRAFIDLPLDEAFLSFKAKLPEHVQECLFFAFPEKAFLEVLDREFDLDMERPALVFRKPSLDAESLRLAAGPSSNFTPAEERWIEELAAWLLELTRSLFKATMGEEKIQRLEAEYRESLRIYAEKYNDLESYSLQTLFVRRHLITRYTHAMTSDALFKAEAIKALLGEQSAYYQAWHRKEIFRHRITKTVERQVLKVS